MGITPAYRLDTWRQSTANDELITYRPTVRTFVRRLAYTVVFFLIAGLLVWAHGPLKLGLSESPGVATTPDAGQRAAEAEREAREAFGEILGQEKFEELSRRVEAERGKRAAAARAEDERFNAIQRALHLGYVGLVGFFVVIGLLPPLTCLCSRVTIRRTVGGELIVTSFVLIPRRIHSHVEEFDAIRTYVKEHYGFDRRGVILEHGWDWIVQLSPSGAPNLPMPAGGATSGPVGPQFLVHRERHQPSMIGKAPEPVRELVKGLRALTGLRAEPPRLIEGRIIGRRRVRYEAPLLEEKPGARVEHVFRPGEPVPAHIQARMDALLESGELEELPDGGVRAVQRRITVRDAAGAETVYDRLEDVPEEVRRRLGW